VASDEHPDESRSQGIRQGSLGGHRRQLIQAQALPERVALLRVSQAGLINSNTIVLHDRDRIVGFGNG
jgi:hypothetical protein